MEHEVFVPVSVERLRAALSDPERVARAVPGLQQDAGTAPVAGRLKVRVAGHTITYRGALRVTAQDDGSYAIGGDATEARGSGSVKLTLSVRLRSAEGGTTVTFSGTVTADGRIAELPSEAVGSSTTRMLSRFAQGLGEGAVPEEAEAEVDGASGAAPETGTASEDEAEPGPTPVFGTEVPQPEAPEAYAEDELAGDEFTEEGEPPAEAAHARRTMIGRSAEEVDHAPPRGRYAPVPAPESVVPGTTLRWAAPAAALAVASAVLVARALRKRR